MPQPFIIILLTIDTIATIRRNTNPLTIINLRTVMLRTQREDSSSTSKKPTEIIIGTKIDNNN